jgi:hypothetical protein
MNDLSKSRIDHSESVRDPGRKPTRLPMQYSYRWWHLCVWLVFFVLFLSRLYEPVLVGWMALPQAALPHMWIRGLLGLIHGEAWLEKQIGGLVGVLGSREYVARGVTGRAAYKPSIISSTMYLFYFVLAASPFLGMRRQWTKQWTQTDRPVWTIRFGLSVMMAMGVLSALVAIVGRTRIWKFAVYEIPYALSEGRFPGPNWRGLHNGFPSGKVPVLVFVALCLASYLILGKLWKKQPAYILMVRVCGLLAVLCAASCLLILVGEAFDYPDWVDMDRSMDGYRTGWVLASTVLVWSMGCWLFLVFGAKRYQEYCRENPEYECRSCGYNLRGTIDTDARLCPECGKGISDQQVDLIRQHQKTHGDSA